MSAGSESRSGSARRGVALLALALAACTPAPRPAADAPLERGQVVLEGVTAHRFEADRVTHEATVSRITFTRGQSGVRGTEIDARLQGDGGVTRITAPQGAWSTADRTTRLTGGVRVTDPAGRTLEAEEIEHDGATDRLRSDAPVVLRGANFEARGTGLDGRVGARLELRGPVEATFESAAQASPR